MADVNENDLLRIGAVMSFEGAYEVANVYHVQVIASGAWTWAMAAADIQEYMDELYQNIEGVLSASMESDRLTVQNITQATTFGAFAWGTPWVGDDAGDRCPPGVCLFTWARTYKARVQIRKYLGVFTEVGLTNGLWTAALRTAAEALMNDHIVGKVYTNGMTMIGIAYNRTTTDVNLAVSATSSAEPSYQRRRRRGRGS